MPYLTNPVWRQAPFLRLLPPLATGIAWQLLFPDTFAGLFLMFFAAGFLLYGIYHCIPASRRLRWSWLAALGLDLLVSATGVLLMYRADWTRRPDFGGKLMTDSSYFVLQLEEPPVEKPKTWKATASLQYVLTGKEKHIACGKALLYFHKQADGSFPLYDGERVMIRHLGPIPDDGNPGAFDYRGYCRRQHVYFEAFLQAGDWRLLPADGHRPLSYFFFRWRDACMQALSRYIPGKNEAGFAEALLLGNRDNLDRSWVQDYANAGVIHIIVLAGLHVGMLYGLLWMLLRIFPRRRWSEILKCMIIIAALWVFALLTGAQPSVLRASLTFSAVAIGGLLIHRKSNAFNTLAASAFLLLCYNPYWLADAGFQLSYLAVFSILIFHKPIHRLWHSRYKAGRVLWNVASVTLAAQVLTFPLCLYYFHQFPLLFLFSNLVAVPMTEIVLPAVLFLLVLAPFPSVATGAGWLTGKAIHLQYAYISWIDHFPYALWRDIPLTIPGLIATYCAIFFIAAWLMLRWKKGLPATLFAIACLSFLHFLEKKRHDDQHKIIVYNTPGISAMDMVAGRRVHFVSDHGVMDSSASFQYNIAPARLLLGASADGKTVHTAGRPASFIWFCNRRLLLIDSSFRAFIPLQSIDADYVILQHNSPVSMRWLDRYVHCSCVVFDASNAYWKIRQWKNACEKLHLRCFSVPDQGAFIVNL